MSQVKIAILSLDEMPNGGPGTNVVANYFDDAEDGNRENGTGHSPHPMPENQGNDDDHGVQCESARDENRRDEWDFERSPTLEFQLPRADAPLSRWSPRIQARQGAQCLTCRLRLRA
jgi:hypothetical protein